MPNDSDGLAEENGLNFGCIDDYETVWTFRAFNVDLPVAEELDNDEYHTH